MEIVNMAIGIKWRHSNEDSSLVQMFISGTERETAAQLIHPSISHNSMCFASSAQSDWLLQLIPAVAQCLAPWTNLA